MREFARLSEPGGSGDPEKTQLTDRQTQVLRLVASGSTYKEVGAKLNLSEVTIRYHMSEILQKLHLEHRSQVIAYAGQMGFGPNES